MSLQTFQNTPLPINLPFAARNTGWSIQGANGIHEACNAGIIKIAGLTLITGHEYKFSYFIDSISSGYVQPMLGTALGTQQTTLGFKQDTIVVAGSNPKFAFYSTGGASLRLFAIKDTAVDTNPEQQNTLVYSQKQNKWKYFWTYVMDRGSSLFTNTYTTKDGLMYVHEQGSANRNNFGGIQYKSIINMVFNNNPSQVKSFLSLSLQVNELMITTENGVTTSLGQVSELIELDFLKDKLIDGATQLLVYEKEGVYSSYFLRDKNEDIINGAPLKGNYISVKLITVNGNALLKLFTVQVVSSLSKIGAR